MKRSGHEFFFYSIRDMKINYLKFSRYEKKLSQVYYFTLEIKRMSASVLNYIREKKASLLHPKKTY